MPKKRKESGFIRDSLRVKGYGNSGLYGLPGLDKAGGWDDPAFRHICVVAMEMRNAGIEWTADTVDAAIKLGRKRYEDGYTPDCKRQIVPAAPRHPSREEMAEKGVIYYVRRGEYIKIGTTIRLKQRMHDLAPDEILAVEPGSFQVEKYLHQKFAHLRAPFMREYFRMDPELMDHIATVVETHGPPPSGLLTFGESNLQDPLAP
jgi:hypothetical protein